MDPITLTTRAKIDARADLDTGALLALAKERAPDPTVFDSYEPAFWVAEISSNVLDYYYTSMGPKMRANFARALNDGVSFQDSHNTYRNGWGQSIAGEELSFPDTVKTVNESGGR